MREDNKTGNIVLKTENLTKQFGMMVAVDQVSMNLYRGEILGLIGENGSGKSTITSMISGVYKRTAGEIYLDGKPYFPKNLLDASKYGVSMIVQEMNTVDDLTVTENLFLGKESEFKKRLTIDKKEMNLQADRLLEKYGLGEISGNTQITEYTFEQRKLIEMIRATFFNPKVLIVDETTTALSYEGREKLFKVMKALQKNGTALIFISHNLEEVIEICDRITVLRDGKHIVTLKNEGLNENELKTYMVGREMTENFYRTDQEAHCNGEVVLKAEDVYTDPLKNFNLELHQGEILGIGGLTASGIHEAGKVLLGAIPVKQGKITNLIHGTSISSIHNSLREGIAYVSKNRDEECLVLSASIQDNICVVNYDKVSHGFFISKQKEKKLAEEYTSKLQTKMENILQPVSELSGGNKQKVVIAKWLAKGSDIFILDSPTRGIDVKVKSAIYDLMQQLTAEGKSIIMISEEIIELIGMCDRILVMNNGEIAATLRRDEVITEEKIIQYAI